MRTRFFPFLFILFLISITSCQKQKDINDFRNSPINAESSGSGSGGSGGGSGGGGGTTTTGLIRSVLSGLASRLVAGNTDSVLVTFSQPAPATGWTLSVSSSNPAAATVPSTVFVPAGSTGIYVRVTGQQVTSGTVLSITVRLNAESKSTSIKVYPLTANFPPPQLKSPGNGANFKNREIVTFTANTNNDAYWYEIQISQSTAFTSFVTQLLLNDPLWRESAFNGPGTYFWRMRFVAAGGGGGPWSEVRTFVQRQQQ
jgi:hypothetical protein